MKLIDKYSQLFNFSYGKSIFIKYDIIWKTHQSSFNLKYSQDFYVKIII